MRESLYIRLRATDAAAETPAPVEWCIQAPPTATTFGRREVQSGPLEEALMLAVLRRVVVIVPGTDVLLSEVNLPIRQPAKLLQAVPYALEDQLAEDPEDLHFAIGPRSADGRTPVAIVARKKLEAWLAPFRAARVEPGAVIPETLCIPYQAAASGPAWSVLLDGDHALVRSGPSAGFSCESSALPDFLALAPEPAKVEIELYRVGASEMPAGFNVGVKHDLDTALSALRRAADGSGAINLLQGGYAARGGAERWWQPLRPTAALAAGYVALVLLVTGAENVKLRHERGQLDEGIQASFGKLFPEITRIVDPRAQAEQALGQLRKGGAVGNLFELMQVLTQSLKSVSGFQVQELQLREGALYLSLLGRDIQSLEALRGYFEKQVRWKFEVQSANASSEGVQVRATLEPRA